jgi:hypothetical protein
MKPKYRRRPCPGIPVLRGFLSDNGKIINVFCPYCDKYHSHGWHPENPSWAIEHRINHCIDKNRPFTGYHIGVLKAPKVKNFELFTSKRKK